MEFSAATWNLLAQAYVNADRYPRCTAGDLDTGDRRQLTLRTARDLDADVLLLQEVEPELYDELADTLGREYEGHYAQRKARPDGCAIFARKPKFRIIRSTVLRYVVPGGHLALLAELEAEHGRVCIACTHLRWQSADTPEDQHLGCSQMRELLSYRREFAPEDARWILAGDFNATPNSSVVNAARASGLSLGCELQRPWHTVNINGRKRKLDYLLYTGSSLRASPLPLPTLSTDTPMPSDTHASDHLPVVVRFRFM